MTPRQDLGWGEPPRPGWGDDGWPPPQHSEVWLQRLRKRGVIAWWLRLSLGFAVVVIVLGIADDAGLPAARALVGHLPITITAPPTPHPPARTPAAPPPSQAARDEIPPRALAAYRNAARYCPGLSWTVLAGIGKVESSHGTSSLPGVHSGVNAFGCCAGPMQFNLRNGPPSTWQRYGVDADRDGTANPYDIDDAAAAAARLLCANGAGHPQGVRGAIFAYNHDWSYVAQVLGHSRRYQARGGGRR
jgi:hypothetical protein